MSKGAPSPNSLSIQLVIISWSGKFKCTLLQLDPVSIFPVSFCPVMDQISSVLFLTGSVSICFQSRNVFVQVQKKPSLKQKHCLQTVCYRMKLDSMFCFFLNWIESKKSSRRVSSASKKSSRNCNRLDPAKYLHPESRKFEFPALGDHGKLDK